MGCSQGWTPGLLAPRSVLLPHCPPLQYTLQQELPATVLLLPLSR